MREVRSEAYGSLYWDPCGFSSNGSIPARINGRSVDGTLAQASCGIDTRGMRQVTAAYNWAMGLGRFLNLDRLAGRFNQWFGATAMAANGLGTALGKQQSQSRPPSRSRRAPEQGPL